MEFSLYDREGGSLVELVAQFKYLGLNLDQSDNKWPLIIQGTRRARKVLVQVGKILQQ